MAVFGGADGDSGSGGGDDDINYDIDHYDQHGGGGFGGNYDDSVGNDDGFGVDMFGGADGDSGGGGDNIYDYY